MKRNLHQLVAYFNDSSQNQDRFFIAIDGPGGSGKSFFTEKLCGILKDFDIVHLDDFYLPTYKPDIIGSNFDWQRLMNQVLFPFMKNSACKYQINNWTTNKLDNWKEIIGKKYLLIEGVTSGRLELRKYLNFIIFIETPPEIRLKRGVQRDGESYRNKWLNEWMPAESKYFDSEIHNTKSICNLVVDGTFNDTSNIDMIKTLYEKDDYFS